MKLDTIELIIVSQLINVSIWVIIAIVLVFDLNLMLNINNDAVHVLQFVTGVIFFITVKKLDFRIFSELINKGKI